ncbi:MAG: hypothetical protein IPL79_00110 [Myxococcales bacterium]|nr:hypothetical protein [Myxococcales bacterium]
MHPKPNVVIAALLALALVISLSLVAGCRHGAGRGVDATASLSGTDLAIGSLRNNLNFETALSSATGAADTVEADAEITRTAGGYQNSEPADMETFRYGDADADEVCVPRRPTKYELTYEKRLLAPGAADASSLKLDDEFVCEKKRMWFTMEQALPDGQLLALGAGSLLMTNASGLVAATYDSTKGWLLGATVAPVSAKEPIAAYNDRDDEYLALTRPGHVAVIAQRATTAAPSSGSGNPIATNAWVVTSVIADPNPRDPSPLSSLHVAGNHVLWWSASKHRGYVFERQNTGDYIYVQQLGLSTPLLATGYSRVVAMNSLTIAILVRQSARAPESLHLFGKYNANSTAHAERDPKWYYESKSALGDADSEFVGGTGSNAGVAISMTIPGSRGQFVTIYDSEARTLVQRLEYRDDEVTPIAITKDVLMLDCTDAIEGPYTCMLVRNVHDRFEPYSNIVGVQPLAYRARVLIGRDHAGPGGAARLVVLRH